MKKSLLIIPLTLLILTSCNLNSSEEPAEHNHTFVITKLNNQEGVLSVNQACMDCHERKTVILSEDAQLKDIPILNIKGDISNASKDNKVTVQIDYYSLTKTIENQYATLKVQGNSSLAYPKKNYNVQFYSDNTLEDKDKIKIKEEWGKQSKYTLKANFIDFSQARNIVSCRLYSKLVNSQNIDDGLKNAPNNGAVDGFPVIVFLNDSYYGLYTLNIPKDNWMFAMSGSNTPNATIIEASKANDYSLLKTPITTLEKDNPEGVEAEFLGDSISENDAIASFNAFTEKIRSIDSKQKLLDTFGSSATLQRSVDYYLFCYLALAHDNQAKNILYVNYDIKDDNSPWFPSIYDFDSTWGLAWTGTYFLDAKTQMLPQADYGNLMWQKLYTYYFDELSERYQELRSSILSFDNIVKEFEEFDKTIPSIVRTSEVFKWPTVSIKNRNNLDQIREFLIDRTVVLDSIF